MAQLDASKSAMNEICNCSPSWKSKWKQWSRSVCKGRITTQETTRSNTVGLTAAGQREAARQRNAKIFKLIQRSSRNSRLSRNELQDLADATRHVDASPVDGASIAPRPACSPESSLSRRRIQSTRCSRAQHGQLVSMSTSTSMANGRATAWNMDSPTSCRTPISQSSSLDSPRPLHLCMLPHSSKNGRSTLKITPNMDSPTPPFRRRERRREDSSENSNAPAKQMLKTSTAYSMSNCADASLKDLPSVAHVNTWT